MYDFNKPEMADVNPGLTTRSKVPFQVPPGTQIAFIEVHDSAFSGGAKVSLAGSS